MSSAEQRSLLSRRGVLRAGAVVGLAASGAVLGAPANAVTPDGGSGEGRPELRCSGARGALLDGAYAAALKNLLDVNTVPYDPAEYDQTGLMADPPGTFVRAGAGYEQPWTRDASVNAWNAASLLTPDTARNTLWAVCRRRSDGTLVVQQDNQWWDQIIWAVAAHHHYLVTGDRVFLRDAHQAATNTLLANRAQHFNSAYGLFEGPAFMQDGIAGYPSPPYDPQNDSSFVLDHPGTDKIMSLSTNCLYHAGYLALAAMADTVGDHAAARRWRTDAAALRKAINARLWIEEDGVYGYFLHGAGEQAGRLEPYQEGNGLAFAVLSGVASARQTRLLLARTHHEPYGVVNVWPHFARFDDAHPGRHNVTVWPMTLGMWGHAAAVGGRLDLLDRTLTELAGLYRRDGHFWELYNARTGAADGGWQNGRQWPSQEDQTWSATGYLRLVHHGVFGMVHEPGGLRFAPGLPPGWGPVALSGLRYRRSTLDLTLSGSGRHLRALTLDGHRAPYVPADLRGRHQVHLEVA
ncbi:hypothetical protein ACFV3R_12435 [Streptomyces sp. NPDC059740]|uniref:MGH1-like glycoside hydrolase domain-containing protein n=1 Tax=Streptomyces sp. NPDC059740 TaxID=3346926 RepID=UPI00366625F0